MMKSPALSRLFGSGSGDGGRGGDQMGLPSCSSGQWTFDWRRPCSLEWVHLGGGAAEWARPRYLLRNLWQLVAIRTGHEHHGEAK